MSTPRFMISTKGWSLDTLLELSPNFRAARRVSATSSTVSDTLKEYERKGVPLVVEGFHKHPEWPQEMFSLDSFAEASNSNGTISRCAQRASA